MYFESVGIVQVCVTAVCRHLQSHDLSFFSAVIRTKFQTADLIQQAAISAENTHHRYPLRINNGIQKDQENILPPNQQYFHRDDVIVNYNNNNFKCLTAGSVLLNAC